jgi:uncharacterized membrane protein YdjX (TVP38/TMEM64 family)
MPIFKQRLSKKTKIQVAIVCAVIVAIIALLALDVIYDGPLTFVLTNKEEVTSIVHAWGIFGPLVFIILQAIQTIIAPIPLSATGIVGGFVFGWWGVLWTTIGSIIGFWVIFWLARKFGRKFIEKIIRKELIDKFDYITKKRGTFVLFLIFLLPGLPDDVVGYIAGLTKIPIRTLLALAIIGRMPAVVATNMVGAGLGEDNITTVVIILVISAVILAVVAVKHGTIMKYLQSERKPKSKAQGKVDDKKDKE